MSVISDRTNKVIATAPVGTEPQFVVVDPVRGNVFVANYGGTTVSVINARTESLTKTITVGDSPWPEIVDLVSGKVYVFNVFSSSVSVINERTLTVTASVSTGAERPFQLAADSANGQVYLTDLGGTPCRSSMKQATRSPGPSPYPAAPTPLP